MIISRRRLPKRLRRWSSRSLLLLAVGLGLALLAAGGGVYAALGGSVRGAQATDINLQKGLVGWWKFDGNTKDSSPYRDNGTITGATLTTDREGKANSAYSFNGSSYITANVALPSTATFSFWATYNGTDSVMPFTAGASGSGPDVFFACGEINWNTWNSCSNPFGAIPANASNGKYHLYTFVIQSGTGNTKLYYDGQLLGTANYASPAGSVLSIGGSSSYNWQGNIDDFRLYNRPLSTAEITALYNQYNPGVKVASGSQGLIGQWKLAGNTKDSSPNRNNGVITGGVTSTTDREGRANSAMSFNGTSGVITAPAATTTTANVTISAWFNFTLGVTKGTLIHVGGANGYSIGIGDNFGDSGATNQIEALFSYVRWIPTGQYLTTNGWHFVTMTLDASGVPSIYMDGQLVGTYSGAGPAAITPAQVSIGMNQGDSSRYFNNSIADVRFYNQPLTGAQIATLYSSYNSQISVSSLQQGEVGDWNFNGNAKDSTPYRNNGAVTGATLTADREGRASSAYSLSGASQYITTPYVQTAVTAYSVSAWVKTTDGGSEKTIVQDRGAAGSGLSLTLGIGTTGGGHGGPGKVGFEVDSNGVDIGVSSTTAINDGQWHHVVGVFSGGGAVTTAQFKIYIDGAQASTTASTAGSATAPLTGSGGTIFGYHQSWGTYLSGSIDDVRIWNRALSAGEVTALYNEYR